MEDSSKKRYNPEELEEFRILIEKKIAQAREDLNMLRAENANDISDTTPTYKDLDLSLIHILRRPPAAREARPAS